MYAVSINTGKIIQKSKQHFFFDKNVHKFAQRLKFGHGLLNKDLMVMWV